MGETQILVVIDASAEAAFEPVEGGPAPVISSLKSIPETAVFAAPVVICAERDMARARGALLVTGDTDGRVIALDPLGTADARLALAATGTARLAPLVAGVAFTEPLIEPAPRGIGPIPLVQASLRGVQMPDSDTWRAACGDDHG